MEKYSWGTYIDFNNTFEITDVYEFVSWFRDKCYKIALVNLKKLFNETNLDDYDLDDNFELEATFFELNFYIEEVKSGRFHISDKHLDIAGAKFTNHIFNKFLFNLGELGLVELYYDAENEGFFWRHK